MAKRKDKNEENGKMKRKLYEKELEQASGPALRSTGMGEKDRRQVIIVFEGRDTAGKGGTIKALTERVSPRVFRVVALPAPSDREKTQMYIQRYIQHFPAAGEIVIFDRSWYNRAGIERVMGFVDERAAIRHFLELCPKIEKFMVDGGITLIKIWLEVGMKEQDRRLRLASTIRFGNGN